MLLRYRPHLWNAALLFASVAIALAADRLAAASEREQVVPSASVDVSPFVTPVATGEPLPTFGGMLEEDPFDREARTVQAGVASGEATPTVSTASPVLSTRRLTAVLIADERRVAVIDESTVSVGDVLRDGSRVTAIQPDRVWLVEKDGRWHMLTLTTRGR